jgi:hypothetical protein
MNNEYRQFLIKNTNAIMQNNFQNQNLNKVHTNSVQIKTYPYLFNGLNDKTIPYGYEQSLSKETYLNKLIDESQKRNLLQNDI